MSDRNHIEKIESCDFVCEAGPLVNNTDWKHVKAELDRLRAELEAAKQDAAKCAAAHINAVSACNENAHLLTEASAELAELRARVPVYQIRLASGAAATAWVDCTEADYHSARLLPEEYRTRELYARHVTPAAVPDDVAKYRKHLELLRDDCTYPAGHVGAVVLNGHRMEIIRDALAAFLAKIDAMPAGEGEESEFQVISGCDEDACIEVATSGPRDVALREAMRYAHQYAEDGPVKVVELVTVAMLAASQQAAKGEGT